MIPKPAVGDLAPEATLLDRTGASVALSSTWQGHPAVLVFLRYFGCPFCQMQVVGLRADRERFEERTTTVVLIGQGSPEEGARFCDGKEVLFECVLDTEGWVYSDYGLGRGSLRQVFGPASFELAGDLSGLRLRAPVQLRDQIAHCRVLRPLQKREKRL